MIRLAERRILAHVATLRPKRDHLKRVPPCLTPDLRMNDLIDMAIREGLGGLSYKNFKGSGVLERLDEPEKEKLATHYYQVVRHSLRLIHALKEILQQTNKKSLRPVLLQGMDIIQGVYDDIGLRPMSDIDLWVLKKEHPIFADTLRELGYQNTPLYPNTYKRGSITVDLHTHLLWADRISTRKLLLNRTDEEIYQETRSITWEGEEARCLSRYDQVIYLGLHGLKHRFNRLIWLVDIKNITAGWGPSEWEALHLRAKELGQPRILGYVLFLLSHVFGYQPPKEVRSILAKRFNLLERRALMGRVKGHELPPWAPPFLFSSDMTWRSRLSFILESLFPRPEILHQVFPFAQGRPWGLYLKRLGQVIGLIRSPF